MSDWTSGTGPAPGLETAEAARRLVRFGRNEISREAQVSPVRLFLGQFRSPLVLLLLAASALSIALGHGVDAAAIAAIVAVNAVVGFLQEHRAEKAVLALRSMTAPRATVLRDGRARVVPSAEVVPGDVLLLEAGDLVAADGKILAAHDLRTVEAPLTGESVPVEKGASPAPAGAPLAERTDSVFLGTSVATGTGRAEVVATGMRTEMGKIAHLIGSAERGVTPLEKRLGVVSRRLIALCLGVVAFVLLLRILRGVPLLEGLLSAVALAVAAVPEGLPAIVTIALAIGVQRMAARNVLVRRLASVETLGCATVICTDKTGTLTTGRMAVREIRAEDEGALLFAAAACCDAELGEDGRGGTGDPTEIAILAAAAERGIRREVIERERPREDERPFSPERKMMSVFRRDGTLYAKGAVEVVRRLSSSGGDGASEANEDLAAKGLRVLAVATGRGREEKGLRFLGLLGIADPPRAEAIDAVRLAKRAGIRTVMITGDHPTTARAIAGEMGILGPGEEGSEVVHARATAEQKIEIVRSWKGRGEIVAMTGDGVNDAPALREAHIGIAMGKTGTEVTREASDMILADDDYSSIVAAVREGRGVYDNIRKALVYLLTGNAGELVAVLSASVLGLPMPLLPLHLLWINLVTDALPALALVLDPPDDDVLERKPRRPDEEMLGRSEWARILAVGLLEGAIALAAFLVALRVLPLDEARNVAFSSLVLSQLSRSFAARSDRKLFWEVGAFTNLRLLVVVAASTLLQVGISATEFTRGLFRIGALSPGTWLAVGALGLVSVTVLEIAKLARRRKGAR